MRADEAWQGIGGDGRDGLFVSGAMGGRVRALDWSKTPLGPIDAWPNWLRAVVDTLLASGQPMGLWIGPHLTTIHNDAFRPLLAERADTALGEPLDAIWPDVFDDILPRIRQALGGETVFMDGPPLLIERNGVEEQTNWIRCYSPVRDENGTVRGFLDVAVETTQAVRSRALLEIANASLADELTEQRESEKRQRVVQRELSHRMKNSLAIIQAIVSQSLRHATSLEEANAITSARIMTLSRAQDILTKTSWKQAEVFDLVSLALEPHVDDAGRLGLDGPRTVVGPQQSLGLALAVHELATNAIKHGSLSNESGRIDVKWSANNNDFRFEWSETGGPDVTPFESKGFGSRLLERIVPGYFGGRATIDRRPEGLVYVLTGLRIDEPGHL